MEFKSILWLDSSEKSSIDPKVIKDLNLEIIYKQIQVNDDILYALSMDKETIEFRQSIFNDFIKNEGLLKDMYECLEVFYELKPTYHKDKYEVTNLYRIIDLLMTIERAIDSLEKLNHVFSYYPVLSDGLKSLKENISENLQTDEYRSMKQDLKEIKYIFRGIRSATLTVSLTKGLRPKLAQVTALADHKYKYPKAFRHVADVLSDDPEFLDKRLTSYVPVFRINKMDYDILEEIEFALKEYKSKLNGFLTDYDHLEISPFVRLFEEMSFYYSSMETYHKIKDRGLPLCTPSFSNNLGTMSFSKGYNIHLANETNEDHIITNDFVMNTNKGFLLTGANRGGKTTFTQAIGQIQVLGQLGLFVPAQEAKLSIVDRVITHFPVPEKESVEKGKFGRECEMFVEAYKQASIKSLVLMNESFVGTSHLESLSIATQGVLALLNKKVPFVFNTHLHELYDEVRNDERMEASSREALVSLTTEIIDEKSTYTFIEKPPIGKSYARKIASKYGVTFEQLVGGEGGNVE